MNVTSIDLMAASKKLQSLKDNFPNDDYLDDKIYRFEQLSDHVGSIRLRCEELKVCLKLITIIDCFFFW